MEKKTEETPLVREIYTDVFKGTWDTDIVKLAKGMPIGTARKIKVWRVDEEHSWRSIASEFVKTYPEPAKELNIVSGNQISGMQLCDAAMKKLKETIDQGWN